MEIKVLGGGCKNCDTLEKNVFDALADLQIDANVSKVKDMAEIMRYGIMMTPGLVINEKVKASGRVPKTEEIKRFINEEN